jgi:diadenosine tetraphosphate (Ap4A) HIT family hydrolase
MKASLVHAYEFRQSISSLSLLVYFHIAFEIGRARKLLSFFFSKKNLILSIGQTKRQTHTHVLGRYRMIAATMTARERETSERERQREREGE